MPCLACGPLSGCYSRDGRQEQRSKTLGRAAPPLCIHSVLNTGNKFLFREQEMHFSLAVALPFVSWMFIVYNPENDDGKARWESKQEEGLLGNQCRKNSDPTRTLLTVKPASVCITQPTQPGLENLANVNFTYEFHASDSY